MPQSFTNVKLVNGSVNVTNASKTANLLAAPGASKITRVTKAMVVVETAAAGGGGVWQLKDGASGTVIIQGDADAVGFFPLDFGEDGYPLSANNVLQLVVASAVTTEATVYAMANGFVVA